MAVGHVDGDERARYPSAHNRLPALTNPSLQDDARGHRTGETRTNTQSRANPELTIGTFQMQNVTVAIMPNMEVDLLGMNVLSHFEMKQMDGVMHLSYR